MKASEASQFCEKHELLSLIQNQAKEIAELRDIISNANDFIVNIPLHTEDEHALHFVEMGVAWLAKVER